MPRLQIRSILGSLAIGVVVVSLSACTPASPKPSLSSSPQASSSPSASASVAPAVFVTPTSCTELLGATLEASLTSDGTVLFSGPGGTGLYPGETTIQDGGTPVSCAYGKDMVDLSTFELAAQGLTQDAHEGVLAELSQRGMVETDTGDTVTFTQVGDEGTTPALLHIVKTDSWVTVYSAFGGAARLSQITQWANTVETQVYH